MALVVESGTAAATSDSYIASDDASDYLASIYGADEAFAVMAESEAKDAILRRACAYIDQVYGERFTGYRVKASQALAWPRIGATRGRGTASAPNSYYSDPSWYVSANEIPVALGRAQAELARRIKAGTDPRPDLERGGQIVSETVDVISVTYSDHAASGTRFQQVEDLLAPYLENGGSRMMVGVSR